MKRPINPGYAGEPVILQHVLADGGETAACADSSVYSPQELTHPKIPRIVCPGCLLALKGAKLS